MRKSQNPLHNSSKSERSFISNFSNKAPANRLSNDKIVKFIKLYRETRNNEYRDAVIYNFKDLLLKTALRKDRPKVDISDILHSNIELMINLIENTFDVESKNKFITYLTGVLNRDANDTTDDLSKTVRLPKNVMSEQRNVNNSSKIKNKKKLSDGRYYFIDEVDIDAYDEELTDDSDKLHIINTGIYRDYTVLIAHLEQYYYNGTYEEIESNRSEKEDINRILDGLLNDQQKKIIKLKFGLDKYDNSLTYTAIAEKMDISRTTVKKIYRSALNILRSDDRVKLLLNKYL